MSAFSPVAGGPVADLGLATTATGPSTTATVESARIEPSVWLVEVVTTAGGATVGLSDRGWIQEPGDTGSIVKYPPRLLESPAVELQIPIYPSSSRRSAVSAGELRIANGDYDATMNTLAGDWTVAGRNVRIYRAPHRRPTHAARSTWQQIATLRTAATFAGTSTLRLPLQSSAGDLDGPACNTYAGTGGQEGDAALAGRNKPRVFGFVRNISPVQTDAAKLIYQIHDGAMSAVVGVRDRGNALTNIGDYANYATLESMTLLAGGYATCLSTGHIRLGSVATELTVDARGSTGNGGYPTSTGALAAQILAVAGGQTVTGDAFVGWSSAEAGIVLRGGTVAAAMDRLAAGLGPVWWGAGIDGAWRGGVIPAPETAGVAATIREAFLAAPPEETNATQAPWWRARVGYQGLDLVQRGADLADIVTAAARAYYSTAQRTAEASDATIRSTYPLAVDGEELPAVLDGAGEAAAVASQMLALYGARRRSWTVRLGPMAGRIAWWELELGQAVRLEWSKIAPLASGRTLIVRGISARGDNAILELWG